MTAIDSKDADKGQVRVMLVDDSAVIRGLIARILESDRQIRVISSVSNGQMAVSSIKRVNPDVVILDIEMPVMDGLTALPLMLKECPGAKVIMCSTLSKKGATVTLQALSAGAVDCVVKPTSTTEIGSSHHFQEELLRLVKGFLKKGSVPVNVPQAQRQIRAPSSANVYRGKPELIAIGSSTGGPQALFTVMKSLQGLSVPIVITQHMPRTFTAILAQHIQQNCGVSCQEGAEGMVLEPGCAYVAPGGFHMKLIRNAAGKTALHIDDGPQENYCKPSVEPMMRSAIDLYGEKILAVILTGMGSDGLAGCRRLVERGGRVIAQDQATSVVWGMPGAVAEAGLCSAILPLEKIGPWIAKAASGEDKKTDNKAGAGYEHSRL